MYPKCGSLAEAHVEFNRLSVPEQVSWNALIAGYAENGKFEEVLNQVYQTKDSWLAIVLHKTDLGRIVVSFPSIWYFVADMLFKTNSRVCFFENKKVVCLILSKFITLLIGTSYRVHWLGLVSFRSGLQVFPPYIV